MTTITDAESAWLEGKANFEEWREEFEGQWFSPLMLTAMRQLWAQLTPDQHQALRAANPEAYDAVNQMLVDSG